MKDFYIVDAHCDTVHLFCNNKQPYDFFSKNATGHIDYPRLLSGGVSLQFFALFVEPEFKPYQSLSRSLQLMEHFLCEMGENKERVTIIQNVSNLEESVKTNRTAALLALEGGEALEGGIELLHIFYRLGLRCVGLTWNQRNNLADGVGVGKAAGGLTDLGKRMVKEMNRLGIVVDGAHIAIRGFYDLLETSEKPVLISHANAADLCGHPRNLTREQLLVLREQGGVVGLTFYPGFITENGAATLAKLLDHFCYMADLIGVESLGLGSDFDGIEEVMPDLSDVSHLPVLIEGLRERGFTQTELRAILGENILRLLRSTLPMEVIV